MLCVSSRVFSEGMGCQGERLALWWTSSLSKIYLSSHPFNRDTVGPISSTGTDRREGGWLGGYNGWMKGGKDDKRFL